MIVIALQLKLWFALIAKSIVVYLFIQLLFVTVNLSSVLKLPFFGWVGWWEEKNSYWVVWHFLINIMNILC